MPGPGGEGIKVIDRPVRLSVVIPAFNEAGRIRQTLEELLAHFYTSVPDFEIRVVDDGSDDDTPDIVESVARAQPRVVLQREPHRGKGWAVRAGLLAATGELRFMCDADLSMPLSELPRCFRHQLLLPRPYLILTKPLRLDIQCQRAASVKIGWKSLDD